jgi:hypothetical protein
MSSDVILRECAESLNAVFLFVVVVVVSSCIKRQNILIRKKTPHRISLCETTLSLKGRGNMFAVVCLFTEQQQNIIREGRPRGSAPTVRLFVWWYIYVTLKSNNL